MLGSTRGDKTDDFSAGALDIRVPCSSLLGTLHIHQKLFVGAFPSGFQKLSHMSVFIFLVQFHHGGFLCNFTIKKPIDYGERSSHRKLGSGVAVPLSCLFHDSSHPCFLYIYIYNHIDCPPQLLLRDLEGLARTQKEQDDDDDDKESTQCTWGNKKNKMLGWKSVGIGVDI